MNEEDFKRRTKQLALRVIRLVEALPQSRTADVIGKQLIRSATSVGANYRSACRNTVQLSISLFSLCSLRLCATLREAAPRLR
jgi:four helix bundle protein